ncbi:MAG: aspartyl protease family protein [Burkholderiales bacterium]|nr:aspartyl protease family protein [Phycisphaerae bacterium]
MINRMGLAIVLVCCRFLSAEQIVGVQAAALDQPRVYMALWRDPAKAPLAFDKSKMPELEALKGLGLDAGDGPTFAVRAFLDTGASDTMISTGTAAGLGIRPQVFGGKAAKVFDVGVSGEESFGISEPLYVGISDFSSSQEGGNPAGYVRTKAPTSLKMREQEGMLEQLTGGIDVAGMPVMMGKVVVIDARGLADLELLKTRVVEAKDKSIPATDSAIKLSYVDFTRFTRVEPAGAKRPVMAGNPMIGPHPFQKVEPAKNEAAKPVVIGLGKHEAKLTMLLDTGAAASMISTKTASQLGITVGDDGWLIGVPRAKQFQLPIGGIGGSSNVTGFIADSLTLPVAKGEPIIYSGAPVLVKDISVTDSVTHEEFTLDGIFGMNFLVASVQITGGLLPDIGRSGASPFTMIVIDNAAGELRLKINK